MVLAIATVFVVTVGLMEFAGVDKAARSKIGVWKMQEWTIRHHCGRGGQCRSGV